MANEMAAVTALICSPQPGLCLSVGAETDNPAITLPSSLRIGAATQRSPISASSLS